MNYYIEFWKRSFDYSGLTNRKEYWMTVLVSFGVAFAVGFISAFVSEHLYTLFAFASFAPGLAITARRVRDAGFSPWCLLTLMVPILGGLFIFVLLLLPSKNTSQSHVRTTPNPFGEQKSPISPEVQQSLAKAGSLVAHQRYQEAIKSYMGIASVHPQVAGECAKNIGASFYYMGSFEQAVQYFEIAKKYGENAHSMDLYINKAQNAMLQSKSA